VAWTFYQLTAIDGTNRPLAWYRYDGKSPQYWDGSSWQKSETLLEKLNEGDPMLDKLDKNPVTKTKEKIMSDSSSEITKGDVPGHPFHGNQYTGGNAGAHFDGFRPINPQETIAQIGKMNILGISGGRVNALKNSHGETVGIQLPVGHGYGVNVLLHPNDTYTVQRTYTRSGTTTIKGQEEEVYADQLGDAAYRAGMYVNVPFGGHKGTLG
jgi:hypothetical protein